MPYPISLNGPVVVVGAEIVGASAAYFLAKAGYEVHILEAATPSSGATGSADGAVSVASKRPGPLMKTALAGIALYRQLASDGVIDGLYVTRSTLMVAENEREGKVLESHADSLAGCGVDVERVAGAALRARLPMLRADIPAVVEVRGEGHAIGYRLVDRLIEAAGLTVERGCTVTALTPAPGGGGVTGVMTDRGPRPAGWVVLAAGAGAATLVGLTGKLHSRKGQLLVTDRAPALNGALPGSLMSCGYLLSKSVAGGAPAPGGRRYGLVIDPLRTGQFLIGGTREDSSDVRNDMEAARRLLTDACSMLPALAELRLIRAFSGFRTATVDGMPLIGRVPGLENVVVAAGFEGDGICLGPISGLAVQSIISGMEPETDIEPVNLEPFDPRRFFVGANAA